MDLGIRFTGTQPTQVLIGSTFAITGQVFVETNATGVPAGQSVLATVELKDPDGLIIGSHSQTWNGFPSGSPALRQPGSAQVLFSIPWSQAQKWQSLPVANKSQWSVTLRLDGVPGEVDFSSNQVTHSFEVIIPDLEVTNNLTISATDPSNGSQSGTFLPNAEVTVSGSVQNIGAVTTQQSIFFPLVARLKNGVGNVVDQEMIILPSGGSNRLEPNEIVNFTISNLHIPSNANTDENFTVEVIVDPADMITGQQLVFETIEDHPTNVTNNRKTVLFAIDRAFATLTVDPDSFQGDKGTFRGRDPVRLSFAVRNTGTVAVAASDTFTARVLLSDNDSSSSDDIILREFDLSGNALGVNLLPNETISFDWVQQLPDNFVGDFYYLLSIESGNGNSSSFVLENTPSLTLISENSGTTQLLATNESVNFLTLEIYDKEKEIKKLEQTIQLLPETGLVLGPQLIALRNDIISLRAQFTNTLSSTPMERPHSSQDGKLVVYESIVFGNHQVFLVDMSVGSVPLLISHGHLSPDEKGNGDSQRPRISADGSTIVFHSSADNLIPGDKNGLEDVFMYKVDSQTLSRVHQFSRGQEANGNSLYPDVNFDGSAIVFESQASNLLTARGVTEGRQIFLWNLNNGGLGSIKALTNGNAESKGASIDQSGNLVVFSSFASNLPTIPLDDNGKEDVFLFKVDANATFLASLTSLGTPTSGGSSTNPVISGDGSTIVFQSSATNMVSRKGISSVMVNSGGAGYLGNPTAIVSDLNGPGTGAVLSLTEATDIYGQILESGIQILSNGSEFVNPIVTIVPDPAFPSPAQSAQVTALLTHPDGELYIINVADVLPNPAAPSYSKRISESSLSVGGDMESREATVSYDGQLVAYATKSSNLLDQNITRRDGEVFYNLPGKIALAKAILVGGIGEIEIQNPGIGYNAGFLKIEDFSGNGSGAVASYQVDSANGRIISITIVNPGANYQLDTTGVSVDNPSGGSRFQAGSLRSSTAVGFGNN